MNRTGITFVSLLAAIPASASLAAEAKIALAASKP
jgi:hypothetical protein